MDAREELLGLTPKCPNCQKTKPNKHCTFQTCLNCCATRNRIDEKKCKLSDHKKRRAVFLLNVEDLWEVGLASDYQRHEDALCAMQSAPRESAYRMEEAGYWFGYVIFSHGKSATSAAVNLRPLNMTVKAYNGHKQFLKLKAAVDVLDEIRDNIRPPDNVRSLECAESSDTWPEMNLYFKDDHVSPTMYENPDEKWDFGIYRCSLGTVKLIEIIDFPTTLTLALTAIDEDVTSNGIEARSHVIRQVILLACRVDEDFQQQELPKETATTSAYNKSSSKETVGSCKKCCIIS